MFGIGHGGAGDLHTNFDIIVWAHETPYLPLGDQW